MNQPTYRVDQAVVWTTAPACGCHPRHARGLASFRRLADADRGVAEVFTCWGSRLVKLAELRPLAPAAARPVHELDYTLQMGGGR